MAKRLLDLILALGTLPVWLPLLGLLSLAVWWRMGRPVFFRQWRPAYRGEAFRIVKLRSMTDARDAAGEPLPDAQRLTPFGRWLRATSLDELPELLQVLGGTISLVGPRPLSMDYLPLYSERQARRHEVKPGLTGWAQIHGRNTVDWPQRLEMDVWYVDNRSLWLDLKILAQTVMLVLRRRGIADNDCATMRPFEGNSNSGK